MDKKNMALVGGIVGLLATTPQLEAKEFMGIPEDKILHYSLSYGLTDGLYSLHESRKPLTFKSKLFYSGMVLGAGIAKEATDDKFSRADLMANLSGIVTKYLVHWFAHR